AAVAPFTSFFNFLVHLYLPPQKRDLVTEILCHHQTMYAAVHDADADATKVSLQNVGAMSGGVHQTRVRDLQGWSEREIFSGGNKSHVRLAHALERIAPLRRHMRKVPTRKHVHRMLPRDLRKLWIRI